MEGIAALYIFMLAAFTGYEVISRVPVILHTPLMSGSNFVHGVVLVGAMVVLGHADPEDPVQLAIGFVAVFLGAANAAGGVRGDRAHARECSKPGRQQGRRCTMSTPIQFVYFIVAVVFILGLKAMSSPVTAREGRGVGGLRDGRGHARHLSYSRHGEFRIDGHRHRQRRCAGVVERKDGQDDRHAANGRDL